MPARTRRSGGWTAGFVLFVAIASQASKTGQCLPLDAPPENGDDTEEEVHADPSKHHGLEENELSMRGKESGNLHDNVWALSGILWKRTIETACPLNWTQTIQAQLANWERQGFTQADLDRHCIRPSLRIAVVNGSVRTAHWRIKGSASNRFVCATWLVHAASAWSMAHRGNPLPDLEMVVQSSDGAQSTVSSGLLWPNAGPLFGSTKCSQDASVSFPLSIHDQFGGHGSGAMQLKLYWNNYARLSELENIPWEEKQARAFFSSGSASGEKAAWERGQRAALFALDAHPLLQIERKDYPLAELGKYRYLIYAYGRCGWSRRIHELAFVRAVIFMEASSCTEYMQGVLRPGVDYIPVKEDFSDLARQVEWVHSQPDRARILADNWYTRARPIFSLPCVLAYTEGLLRAYAKMQLSLVPSREDWPVFDPELESARSPKFLSTHGSVLPSATCPIVHVPRVRSGLAC